MTINRFLLSIVVALAATSPLAAADVPKEVATAIAQARKDCDGKVTLGDKFMTRLDVNADGLEDFILDYGEFSCSEMASLYCGSAGCTQEVYASLPDGAYAAVFGSNAHGIEFKTARGKPVMVLSLHGSACSKPGAAACRKTLVWNGKTFAQSK